MLATDGPYCPYIHVCSLDKRPQPWSVRQRRLAHYLLVCSTHGEEQLVVEGVKYPIQEGQSYLVTPGAFADLVSERGSTPAWVHFDVKFDARRKEHTMASAYERELGWRAKFLQPSPHETWGVELPVMVPAALSNLFRTRLPRLIELWTRGETVSIMEATALLNELLLTWVAYEWRRKEGNQNLDLARRLQRAEKIALQSLDTGFGVKQFAAAAHLSRAHFSVLYKRERGLSPGTFLRRERMRLAEALLSKTELSVKEIGAQTGIPDPVLFGRIFKTAHGVTPGQWRKRATGGT